MEEYLMFWWLLRVTLHFLRLRSNLKVPWFLYSVPPLLRRYVLLEEISDESTFAPRLTLGTDFGT